MDRLDETKPKPCSLCLSLLLHNPSQSSSYQTNQYHYEHSCKSRQVVSFDPDSNQDFSLQDKDINHTRLLLFHKRKKGEG